MKQKSDPKGRQRGQIRASSHPWVGRGTPSGLIKPFELDRRKQSEDSSIEPAGPSRSKSPIKKSRDGTAVAAGAPANAAELPPACSRAPGGPGARLRGLFERAGSDVRPPHDSFLEARVSATAKATSIYTQTHLQCTSKLSFQPGLGSTSKKSRLKRSLGTLSCIATCRHVPAAGGSRAHDGPGRHPNGGGAAVR